MNNYKKHFERELEILEAGLKKGDNLAIKDFIPEIESITEKFSKQGHSGSSAPLYAGALSQAIKNVLLFKPMSPLTGKDDEWNDVGETLNRSEKNEMYQNKRSSDVFKDGKDGKPYYLNAIVWQGKEKYDTFTGTVEGIQSRQYFNFPFLPKRFYVDVVENETDYEIKDISQLEKVWEIYEKPEILK